MSANGQQVAGNHYLQMGIQPWEVIDTWPVSEQIGYYKGTVIAYLMRAGYKDPLLQDLKKANHVLSKLIEQIEKDKIGEFESQPNAG